MSETNGAWHLEILAPDGEVDRRVDLSAPELEVGRRGRGLAFAEDVQMANHHARLLVTDRGVEIVDSGEGSGVWLRQRGSDGHLLVAGDQVWLGAQILVVVEDQGRWRLRHHGSDGRLVDTHELPEPGLFIGRDSELVLDLSDRALSRRHAQIVLDEGIPRLYDRGAHNGSFLKLREPEILDAGAEFRVSMQHMRLVRGRASDSRASSRSIPHLSAEPHSPVARVVDRGGPRRPGLASRLRALGSARDRREESRAVEEATEPIESPVGVETRLSPRGAEDVSVHAGQPGVGTKESGIAGSASPGTEPSGAAMAHEGPEAAGSGLADPFEAVADESSVGVLLVIDSDEGSVTLETQAGKTVLEAVQEAGLERGSPVDWECKDGRCGVCVLGVVEGAGRMDPPDRDSGEMKTIQITEQVVPDPTRYRLACLARVRGTVRLRKLD